MSAALIREENRVQLPIYYVIQAFQRAKVRYPRVEKIVFSLIFTSHKLHPYFQANPILVMTNQPCMHVISMHTQVSCYGCRYLPQNPNSDFLCCLVWLFHMFYLVLNPLLPSPPFYVYTYLSPCLIRLFVFNMLRLGFHEHAFKCPFMMP